MTEEAESAKEISKAAQPLTKALGQRVGDLLGPGFKEYGLLWGDKVGAWRERNAARILERAQENMRARQIEGRTLPPRFLLPALEAASGVDEPELHELWAELIANGAADEEDQQPRYIQTLTGMSAADAKVLEEYARADTASLFVRRGRVGAPSWQQNTVGERLHSVGLLEPTSADAPAPRSMTADELRARVLGQRDHTLRISNYGRQRARAVGIRPSESSDRRPNAAS